MKTRKRKYNTNRKRKTKRNRKRIKRKTYKRNKIGGGVVASLREASDSQYVPTKVQQRIEIYQKNVYNSLENRLSRLTSDEEKRSEVDKEIRMIQTLNQKLNQSDIKEVDKLRCQAMIYKRSPRHESASAVLVGFPPIWLNIVLMGPIGLLGSAIEGKIILSLNHYEKSRTIERILDYYGLSGNPEYEELLHNLSYEELYLRCIREGIWYSVSSTIFSDMYSALSKHYPHLQSVLDIFRRTRIKREEEKREKLTISKRDKNLQTFLS